MKEMWQVLREKKKIRHWLEESTKQKASCKVQEGLKEGEDSFSKQKFVQTQES